MCSNLRTNIFTINASTGNTSIYDKDCYLPNRPLFIAYIPFHAFPPFSSHQIIHGMRFTKAQFITLNRYFTTNFGQIYLFCIQEMLITNPSPPSPEHDFTGSTFYTAFVWRTYQRFDVPELTGPKKQNSGQMRSRSQGPRTRRSLKSGRV